MNEVCLYVSMKFGLAASATICMCVCVFCVLAFPETSTKKATNLSMVDPMAAEQRVPKELKGTTPKHSSSPEAFNVSSSSLSVESQ